MACRYIARWEEQGIGAQWDNYYKSPLPDDTYSLGTCINMMLLDAVIYLLILWYLENVMPGNSWKTKSFFWSSPTVTTHLTLLNR